jgi:Cu(I)/Ag(I) efflux system membrane fusion protein
VGRIDRIEGGRITLSHQPVPAIKWPAMTMTFHLGEPDLARGFKAGDRVRFTFDQLPAGPTIRSIIREGSR